MSETTVSKPVIKWELEDSDYSQAYYRGVSISIIRSRMDSFSWEIAKLTKTRKIVLASGFEESIPKAKQVVMELIAEQTDNYFLENEMSDSQRSNRDFMRSVGQPVRDTPGMPSEEQRLAHFKIIHEEFMEFADSWGIESTGSEFEATGKTDLIESADAMADIVYTVLGAANASGIALQPILDEVCANNMLKVNKGEMVDGKLIKPKDHPKPDIEGLLKQQGWEVE